MGKAKKKSRAVRSDPFGGVFEDTLEDTVEDELFLLNVSSQLKSYSSDERETGCISLTLLREEQLREIARLPTLVVQNMLRILIPLIFDPLLSVSNAAMGALLHTSSFVLEALISVDILSPLCAFLNDCDARDVESSREALYLLWNCVRGSERALCIFNQNESLLKILLRIFETKDIKEPLILPALQTLLSVSEGNHIVKDVILSSSLFTYFPQNPHHKMLLSGILLNLSVSEDILIQSLSSFREILLLDSQSHIHQLSSFLSFEKENSVSNDDDGHDDDDGHEKKKKNNLERQYDSLQDELSAQILALELLANMSSGFSEEDETSGEEMEEDECDQQFNSNPSSHLQSSNLSSFLGEALSSEELLRVVIEKGRSLPFDVINLLHFSPFGKDLLEKVNHLRSSAFLCASNLLDSGRQFFASRSSDWMQCLWKDLMDFLLCNQNNFHGNRKQKNEEFVFESMTFALRALTVVICETKLPILGSLSLSDLQEMTQIGAESESSVIRRNMVDLLGNIGRLQGTLSNKSTREFLTVYLTEVASHDEDLLVVSEALDKIFDMFAEDATDSLASETNLLGKLAQIEPLLKDKMSKNKKSTKFPLLSMAHINLLRFLDYKGKRLESL